MADIVRRFVSLGHIFNVPSATFDDDRAGAMAVAPGSEAAKKLKMHGPRRSTKMSGGSTELTMSGTGIGNMNGDYTEPSFATWRLALLP